LTPERFREIRKLFEAALERPPAEREAFVTAESGDDLELRTEVLEMLRAEAEAGGPIDDQARAALPPPFLMGGFPSGGSPMESQDLEGRRIGPYLLQRRIGSGGMGTVYLATRDDEAFKKQVAVKIVQPRIGGPDLLRHFQQERQILAALDHPNIARLLDGGTTSDGIPYVVMEYVEGRPIDEYCNDRKLNVTERLKLFREVCAAVHYAHQNLIVHRDLKPSNILVTENGTVKLLDFGIAKLLHTDGRETPTLTWTGARLMTPEYASPEQVKGEAITTATDVYSLGVVLYELLTGHRPYRLKSRLLHEVVRIICEEEPTRPSTVISLVEEVNTDDEKLDMITPDRVSEVREGKPGRLKKRLTGDLDSILLVALRKEPQKRYGSVEQFSEDLQRHLAGLPLISRRGAFPYRARKFVRRNRKSLAALALVLSVAILYFFLEQSRKTHQQSLTAQDLFYSMKFLDLDIANLERIGIRLDMQRFQPQAFPEFTKHIVKLRERRREVEKGYDRLLDTLGVYRTYSEQELLVLRVARIFGECELTVPRAFMADVQKHIKLWQTSRRFERAIQNAREKGYIKRIVEELSGQNLPPQLVYIALQESDFTEHLSGPHTYRGIAKGMWQFTPETAVKYGLRIGPLADSRQQDPADERLQWDKATRAAALYLKDLYTNETQASALLTIAYFNWGEVRLGSLLPNLDENPRDRNFWRLFSAHRHRIPHESYHYMLYIVSAAVIGENPRLFGFNFDNPLV
jgi:serine/threonine protein kinase